MDDGRSYNYKQLSEGDSLTNDDIDRISKLIYETDPFIYPAMFGSYINTKKLMPYLIEHHDPMFKLQNIFVAQEEGRIIGIVLWVKGSLIWTPELIKEACIAENVPVSEYLDLVAKEYVESYNKDREAVINIINVCVLQEYRGVGIGEEMMKAFFDQHKCSSYELCVLKENENAVKLYTKLGFVQEVEYRGFTVDERVVYAYKMLRNG